MPVRGLGCVAALVLVFVVGCPTHPPEDLSCEVDGTGCGPFFLGPAVPLFANCFRVRIAGERIAICFTCPCNVHDDCYGLCGTIKDECDGTFFEGMMAECTAALGDGVEAEPCRNRAALYHALVSVAGNLSFNRGQQLCEEPAEKPVSAIAYPPAAARPEAKYALPYDDLDGDWLPDAWERTKGLDPDDPRDAMMDFDGDGLVNLGEYLMNFDPLSPDSDGNGVNDLMEMFETPTFEE